MAFLSLLPLRVLFSHFVHSAITGVLLSVCLFVNAAVIPTPTQTVPIPLVTSDEEASANTPPSPQGALYLQQPPKEKAVEGEDVVFPCLLKSDVDEEAAVEKVSWYVYSSKGRRNVLQDNETLEDAFAGRVFLSGDVSMGDLSMTLRNVSVEDQGLYLCVFISTNSTVLQGGGTKLSIRKESGVIEESVGTIIGIVVAAVGVALGLVAVILSQFKDKLNCLQM
ncbi:immunoglobulin superfamily member [Triplophysa rosa]|uniref:Natural cytotoxicity triggering receptor 3 n=1 Tax=Triplophysa rosa TaxID=992332 RepID=A0A9W8C9H3_TRIRA|nr:immunoglobulin superfamily member [Triplophysa rosa]KAI7812381.1 putative natural cytotoxicity triggering receptor 3 [Triplophysa rosa]